MGDSVKLGQTLLGDSKSTGTSFRLIVVDGPDSISLSAWIGRIQMQNAKHPVPSVRGLRGNRQIPAHPVQPLSIRVHCFLEGTEVAHKNGKTNSPSLWCEGVVSFYSSLSFSHSHYRRPLDTGETSSGKPPRLLRAGILTSSPVEGSVVASSRFR